METKTTKSNDYDDTFGYSPLNNYTKGVLPLANAIQFA